MRYFELIGIQHVVLFVFPTLIFITILYLGLSRSYFSGKESEERLRKIVHTYPEGLNARNAPFPLILILIIIGYVLWAFLYTFVYGYLGVGI